MSPRTKYILILIFAGCAALRFADALRPLDRASWRESDLGAVSRNYVREGMNPFYPRIDWRGNSEGFTEMEFPLYPFLTAIGYEIFGYHEILPRLINFFFSLVSLFFFFRLARSFLDDWATLFAVAFFAFHPLTFETSTSIQPEGLMLLCYTAGIWFFLKWLNGNLTKDFIFALVFTALTILAKAPAAHIGLLFAVLLLQKFGLAVFKQRKVWLFGIFSLLPSIFWYAHAKSLWRNYGNSLGVSNETHLVGADFFTESYFIKGILSAEFFAVWLGFGLLVGAFAVWKGFREKIIFICLVWLAAAFSFYVIAARTTADEWAVYYHIFSVAPAALLFGFGVREFLEKCRSYYNFSIDWNARRRFGQISLIMILTAAIGGAFLFAGKKICADYLDHRVKDESLACAEKFKPFLNKEGLILVSGGRCFDEQGFPVAYNASFMFYWLDRKGFNICVEAQSLERVKEFAAAGAVYFVAQKDFLAEKPNLEYELRQNFAIAAECEEMILFDLENIESRANAN